MKTTSFFFTVLHRLVSLSFKLPPSPPSPKLPPFSIELQQTYVRPMLKVIATRAIERIYEIRLALTINLQL
jgi:hypothetical protein